MRFRRLIVWIAAAAPALVATQSLAQRSYEDHRVVTVQVEDVRMLGELTSFMTPLQCRLGVGPVNFVADDDALVRLADLELQHIVIHEDVQQLIDAEAQAATEARARGRSWFELYRTYAEMDDYVDELVGVNPAIASRVSLGSSLEGREIFGLVIGAGAGKPQLLLNGCQHAREWIAPAITFYAADQLIRNYGSDPEVTALVDSVEFHIVPMVNPDGYIYTHTNDRLWRKNRRNNGNGSFGVDLNRNWDYEWGGVGSSGSTSSPIYRGPSPESEPEVVVLRSYMETLTNLKGHLDIHSFAQALLGPWAYSTTITPPRADELIVVHDRMAEAMFASSGTFYEAGLGTDVILSPAAGVCPDWVSGNMGALAWTLESRDTGAFGFELPASQIIPTGVETFEGVKELAEHVTRTLEFLFPTGRPTIVSPDVTTNVDIEIAAWNLTTYQTGTATLQARVGGTGGFTATPLTGAFPDFSATLPAAACGQTIEFYFEAMTASGDMVRSPEDPGAVYTATAQEIGVVFEDDFESDLGWAVSGDASDGQWDRGVPVGGGDRADPPTDSDGSGQCFLTDNVDGNSDVDGGSTILTSPVLDASSGGVISYDYWADQGPGVFSGDSLSVEVATDAAGANWTQVRLYSTPQASWRSDSIDVESEIGLTSTLRVRFIAADLGSASLIEAGVDAFRFETAQPCPDCPGDATGDGVVDFLDLNAVLENWGDAGPDGDVNGDNAVNFDDLNEVLGAWSTACN
ncbi:MAG: M14 family zinc carboxypeptidase [Phycisphaerales bacterium]